MSDVPKSLSNYFRKLGKKATGEKKRRSPEHYAEMVRRRLEKASKATVEEKKSEV